MYYGNIITLGNLIKHGLNEYVNYYNKIVISYISDLRLFYVPCRVNATTVLVCLRGEMEGTINLRPFKLGKYSVVINSPENIIRISRVENVKAFAILISDEYKNDADFNVFNLSRYYIRNVNRTEPFEVPREEIKVLAHYLAILRNAISSPVTSSSNELMKHFTATFLTNINLLREYYQVPESRSTNGPKNSIHIFERFMELIKLYHHEQRDVKFYADKMCITPKYLSTVVKRLSGKKALDWISEFVILEAKALLKYSGKDVQEVANSLNFSSQSNFGKYFKSHVGMSPSEFVSGHYPIT